MEEGVQRDCLRLLEDEEVKSKLYSFAGCQMILLGHDEGSEIHC